MSVSMAGDFFAVQGQDEADEAVGAGVVRPEVQDELVFSQPAFQVFAGVQGLMLAGVAWV